MCGIAGIIHKGQFAHGEKLAKHFLDGLEHRGPDFQNYQEGDGYLLMHTRLSIIDLSTDANQPFISDNGRYLIVFNGEIYNYKELRKKLQVLGYSFRTCSDTEVLLQGFIAWKEKLLNMIDGFFAFTIYDKIEKKLFAARDRVGKKPFFYSHTSDFFCFASESDVIASSGIISKKLSLPAVNSFLAIGYILSPQSLYENIYQLMPGTYLWLDSSNFGVQLKEYWNILGFYQRKVPVSANEASEKIGYLLRQAVQKRLIADVEIGVFLSGGIDSSIVALLAGEQHMGIKTFTASFNQSSFDESHFAARSSKQIGATNFLCNINNVGEEDMMHLIDQTDGVLADTSLLAMNPLAKFTSQYVKAVLSGDGADELFGGYATYKAIHWKNKLGFLPPATWGILQNAGKFLPVETRSKVSLSYKWDKFFGAGKMDDIQAHYHFREHHSVKERVAIMGKEHEQLIQDTNPLIQFGKYYKEAESLNAFEKLLYVDFKTWLVDDILVKTDRSTMRWGLEVRSPFLDISLLEFTASLPAQFKIDGGYNKQLLRTAFKDILPPNILKRKKSGFNVPLVIDKKRHASEYKFFNYSIYKHKINGQYSHSGV